MFFIDSLFSGLLMGCEINSNMGGVRFGIDANGNYGYKKAGADTVIPFSSGATLIGTVTGNDNGNAIVDCKSLPNYQKLTTNNFIIEFASCPSGSNYDESAKTGYGGASGCSMKKSYNASSGMLTVAGLKQYTGVQHSPSSFGRTFVQKFTCKVYLVG